MQNVVHGLTGFGVRQLPDEFSLDGLHHGLWAGSMHGFQPRGKAVQFPNDVSQRLPHFGRVEVLGKAVRFSRLDFEAYHGEDDRP